MVWSRYYVTNSFISIFIELMVPVGIIKEIFLKDRLRVYIYVMVKKNYSHEVDNNDLILHRETFRLIIALFGNNLDMKTFRKKADWYHKRGISHRRGYLLYGPPGTGKTSTIQAVAVSR